MSTSRSPGAYANAEQRKKLKAASKATGLTMSQILRLVLRNYLDKQVEDLKKATNPG